MVASSADPPHLTERYDLHGSTRWTGSRGLWAATDRRTQQDVWLHLAATDDRRACRLLGAGAATRAMVQHPCFAPVLATGVGVLDARTARYVAVERALGPTVANAPLSAEAAPHALRELLTALQRLHREGYAHGAIQPSSVVVAGDRLVLSGLPRLDARVEDDLAGVTALAAVLLPGVRASHPSLLMPAAGLQLQRW